MKKLPLTILVVLVFALSGCMTAEEQRQADRGQCANFGFRPDSSGFANCMMNLSNQRQLNETIQGVANARRQAEQYRIDSQRAADEDFVKQQRKFQEERMEKWREAEEDRMKNQRRAEEERMESQRRADEKSMRMQREAEEERMERQREAEEKRRESQREAEEERIKELAKERSGDERFPVCSPMSEDSDLDIMAGGWTGRNCRVK